MRCGRLTKLIFPNAQLTPPSASVLFAPLFRLSFMYAVMETGGKQYRVTTGDTLEIDRLNDTQPGQTFTFERVLLVNNDGKVNVGAPVVTGAKVLADVVEHKRGDKVIIFKMKRRKGYHKKQGFRAELTVVKIKEITA
jgi:large subunit ribosomal protein L21